MSLILGLCHPARWSGGCGEVYWGDFHGDPPDLCDPCDRQGCWTGGGYGGNCHGDACYGDEVSPGGGCSTCGSASMAMGSQATSPREHVVARTKGVPTRASRPQDVHAKALPAPPAKPQAVSPEAARPIRAPTRR